MRSTSSSSRRRKEIVVMDPPSTAVVKKQPCEVWIKVDPLLDRRNSKESSDRYYLLSLSFQHGRRVVPLSFPSCAVRLCLIVPNSTLSHHNFATSIKHRHV